MAAPQLGHDDAAGEALAQHPAAFTSFRPAQQPQVLGDTQPAVLAQMRFQRAAVRIAQPAGADHPIGKTAPRKVGASSRVPPQRVPIQSASGVQHKLLFERQPVPPAVLLWCQSGVGGSLPRRWHRRSCEPGARLTDGVEMLMHSDEVQNVSGRSAAAEGDDGRALVGAAAGDFADEQQDADLPF